MPFDIDVLGSGAHLNMFEHLSGPMAEGAKRVELPVSPAGRVVVDWNAREPLVVASPRLHQGTESLRLSVVLDPDGAAVQLPDVEFSAYSESGAYLPLYQPPVAASTSTAAPFDLELALSVVASDGSESTVPVTELSQHLELQLIEGVLGRLIFVLASEKSRIRRTSRELAAQRLLDTAHLDALDRLGSDLGVPRFADNLLVKDGEVVTETRRETDAEYRRRLAIYKPFLLRNRRTLLELLNGPGEDADPNAGLLSELGLADRLLLREEDNEFAVAIHLVSVGDDAQRANFLEHIRRVRLIQPRNDPPSNQIHAARFLPADRKSQVQELRSQLRGSYQFPPGSALAPGLAAALARVARCREALGVTAPWPVLRTQDDNAGSRYELGLGADLAVPPAAEINALRVARADPNRPPAEPEIEALLQEMTPRSQNEDPEGRWLLEACGLRTVHRIDSNRVYVSHFPTFGLVVTGDQNASAAGAAINLEAHYHAPGDPGKNVVLTHGLAAALAAWTTAGHPAWQGLTDAQAQALWQQAVAVNEPALSVLRGALLPAVTDPAAVVERLQHVALELLETVRLPAQLSASIFAGQPQSIADLRELVQILREQGLASALPLVMPGNEVLLVISPTGLPEAGINLSERRSTGFRWYAAPIQGPAASIRATGDQTVFTPAAPGLYAAVCIGYARRGLTDPFEYEVNLPDGSLLDLLQYEYLMNLLDHTYPLGVEVNTYRLRREHVDLDGDGNAEPLLPAASRTYRTFLRPRYRG